MPYISIDFANPTRMEARCVNGSQWLNIYDDADNRIALHVPFALATALADAFLAHQVGEAAAYRARQMNAPAPELLEALEDCVSRFVTAFPAAEEYEPIKAARAAIAKAKGESQ